MNFREMLRIAGALSVGGLLVAIPWLATRVLSATTSSRSGYSRMLTTSCACSLGTL